MGEIKINSNDIEGMVTSVIEAGNDINISIESIEAPNICSGIMLEEYYNKVSQIRNLLQSYILLLNKDMSDIITAKNKLVEMDSQMKSIY